MNKIGWRTRRRFLVGMQEGIDLDQANVAQLARRIALLEKWRDSGFNGG